MTTAASLAYRLDPAQSLHAEHCRVLERVGAHAVGDVDVVESACLLLQQHYGRTGRRDSNVFVAKDFGTARFVNADSLDHQARCSLKKLIVRSLASLAEAAS